MFKDINWNVTVPVVLGALVAGVALWFATKPGGILNKDDDKE
jgi:hypothetical protein